MNKIKLSILLCAATAAIALSGCASTLGKIASATTTPQYSYLHLTNTVAEARVESVTNQVPVVSPGAAAGETVTNYVPQIVLVTNEVPVTRVQTVTNVVYVNKEAIDRGLQIAQTAAPFIPAPFGTVVTAVAGAFGGIFGLLAAYKNKQANAATSQRDNVASQLAAVVHGVEKATSALDAQAGAQVKETIATISKYAGVAADLDKTVQALTQS